MYIVDCKNSFICYAFGSHTNLGLEPHLALGPLVGHACIRMTESKHKQ